MNYFKGLIKCSICNKNYNFKLDHGDGQYICSGTKNYGSEFCKRRIIKEDDIINLIKGHCDIFKKEFILDNSHFKLAINKITIGVNGEVEILYKDGKKSTWDLTNLSF